MANSKGIVIVMTPDQVSTFFKKCMEVVAEVCNANESRFVDIHIENQDSPVTIVQFEIVPDNGEEVVRPDDL